MIKETRDFLRLVVRALIFSIGVDLAAVLRATSAADRKKNHAMYIWTTLSEPSSAALHRRMMPVQADSVQSDCSRTN
jgi:hypothetical protein